MLLLAARLLADQGQIKARPHEKNYFTRPQAPRSLFQQLTGMQLTFLVLFVHPEQCEGRCDRAVQALRPLAEANLGVTPMMLVDCSRASSEKFCREQKVRHYPTLRMYNQDFRYQLPQDYDEDVFEPEEVQAWVYELRRAIFDMSPRADAFAQLFAAPQEPGSITFIYLSPGPYLPLYLQRYCILAHGQARNVHQPGFDAEMREYLRGTPLYDVSEPSKVQLFAYYEDKLHKFTGEPAVPAIQQWMAGVLHLQ